MVTVDLVPAVHLRKVWNMKVDEKKVEMYMARLCLRKQDLAKLAGISPGTVTKVLAGYEVTARTAGKIAKGMGLEVEEILLEG